jgi:hypothetical protein
MVTRPERIYLQNAQIFSEERIGRAIGGNKIFTAYQALLVLIKMATESFTHSKRVSPQNFKSSSNH